MSGFIRAKTILFQEESSAFFEQPCLRTIPMKMGTNSAILKQYSLGPTLVLCIYSISRGRTCPQSASAGSSQT